MKWIDKKRQNQPDSLVKHLKTPHHHYDNYAAKDDLRKALLTEQGFICCYCLQRINEPTADKMVIEHFKPQRIYDGTDGKPDLRLDYENLLASCKGNEGAAKHLQHCDECKSHAEIQLNPSDKTLMQKVRFNFEGLVYIAKEDDTDGRLNADIEKVLNLNIQTLKEERKAIWQRLDQIMRKEFHNKPLSKSFVNQKIKQFEEMKDGKFEAYCQVTIYYLQKKLRKAI